jgi:hypothetical protein
VSGLIEEPIQACRGFPEFEIAKVRESWTSFIWRWAPIENDGTNHQMLRQERRVLPGKSPRGFKSDRLFSIQNVGFDSPLPLGERLATP